MKKRKFTAVGIIIIVLLAAAGMLIIGNPFMALRRQQLKRAVSALEAGRTSLNETVPFEWESVYTFEPYTSESDMEAVMGFSSNAILETVNEGMVQLIFVKEQEVVCSICGHADSLGYDISFHDKILFSENAVFEVIKENGLVTLVHKEEENYE